MPWGTVGHLSKRRFQEDGLAVGFGVVLANSGEYLRKHSFALG